MKSGTGQTDRFAGSPFGRVQALTNISYRLTEVCRRQALGFK
jgi:hypothetical protein